MPNESMRELWTKHGGPAWISNNELFESVYAPWNDAVATALEPLDGLAVLDVGCGPGSLSGVIVGRGGRAVGIDIAETMVEGARDLVPGATFAVADAQTDDLRRFAPPDGFDAAASRFGVMFFEDSAAAFGNIRRAVRTSGRLAFVCWRSEDENPTFTLGTNLLLDRLPEPLPAPAPGAPGAMAFADPDVVRVVLDEAGWSDVAIEPFDGVCDYGTDGSDGVERRVRMILSGQSGRLAREQLRPSLGEQGWNDLIDDVRAEVRRAIVDGRVQFPGCTWLVTAANPAA
jgi:SAM-dependent methyltransferase